MYFIIKSRSKSYQSQPFWLAPLWRVTETGRWVPLPTRVIKSYDFDCLFPALVLTPFIEWSTWISPRITFALLDATSLNLFYKWPGAHGCGALHLLLEVASSLRAPALPRSCLLFLSLGRGLGCGLCSIPPVDLMFITSDHFWVHWSLFPSYCSSSTALP